jgi:hypothetical protein
MTDNRVAGWWDAESVKNMSTARIRRNQDVVAQQIKIAHSQGNTEALEALHGWAEGYTQEMYRRLMEGEA